MKTLLMLALALTGHAVHAQAVYRCGPEGRSYSETPCAHGRVVEVSDERSAQQRRDALDVAERDRALADSLEHDRLARDAQPRASAGKIDGRIGFARASLAEPSKKNEKKNKKRSSPKAPKHAERYKAPAARS